MQRVGLSAQMLRRGGSTWIKASSAQTSAAALVPLCHDVRPFSTTRLQNEKAVKKAAKKATAKKEPTKKEAKATSKAKSSTKAAQAEALKPQVVARAATKTKAKPPPTAAPQESRFSGAAVATPKTASEGAAFASPGSSPATGTTMFGDTPQAAAPPPPQSVQPAALRPTARPAVNGSRHKVSQSSTEYKAAAWKWTSTIVALPILLVTSYFLFERLALGNQPSLDKIRAQIRGDATGTTQDVQASDT